MGNLCLCEDRKTKVVEQDEKPSPPSKPVTFLKTEKAPLKFHLTGFGQFMNVEKNPTTLIIEKIQEEGTNDIDIGSLKVLDVTCAAADEYVDEIYTTKVDSQDRHVVVHLGVYCGSECFNLETTGKNFCRSETMEGAINTEEDQSH